MTILCESIEESVCCSIVGLTPMANDAGEGTEKNEEVMRQIFEDVV